MGAEVILVLVVVEWNVGSPRWRQGWPIERLRGRAFDLERPQLRRRLVVPVQRVLGRKPGIRPEKQPGPARLPRAPGAKSPLLLAAKLRLFSVDLQQPEIELRLLRRAPLHLRQKLPVAGSGKAAFDLLPLAKPVLRAERAGWVPHVDADPCAGCRQEHERLLGKPARREHDLGGNAPPPRELPSGLGGQLPFL